MKQGFKTILVSVMLLALAVSAFAIQSTLGLRGGVSYPQALDKASGTSLDKDYNGMIGLSYEIWLKKYLSLGLYPYLTKLSATEGRYDYTSNVVGGDLLLKVRPDIEQLYFGKDAFINRIAPYATVGIGLSNYFPKYNDHHFPGYPDAKYDYTSLVLPSWGLGLTLMTKLPVDFELGFQKEELASDYLDGYEHGDKNDAYWMGFVGISRTVGKQHLKPKYIFLKETPLVLSGITFEFDSANLTPEALPILDDVIASLMYYPEVEVEIQGHTDNYGTDEYNLKLSQERADSVKEYLVRNGIAEYRLTTSGWGESKPVATNDTDEGRAQNRRIEFIKVK